MHSWEQFSRHPCATVLRSPSSRDARHLTPASVIKNCPLWCVNYSPSCVAPFRMAGKSHGDDIEVRSLRVIEVVTYWRLFWAFFSTFFLCFFFCWLIEMIWVSMGCTQFKSFPACNFPEQPKVKHFIAGHWHHGSFLVSRVKEFSLCILSFFSKIFVFNMPLSCRKLFGFLC